MPWKDIPGILGWNYSVYAIEAAFKYEGFTRRTTLKNPLLLEAHMREWLAWVEEYKN
jgi:hypothetical protein